jgi:hypothetical protein
VSHADAVGDAIKAAIAAIDDESEDVIRDVWRAVAHELLSASLPRTAYIALTATQSGNTGTGQHVEFNAAAGKLVDDGLVTLSSVTGAPGTDQNQGVVTLAAGTAYRLEGVGYVDVVNGGFRVMRLQMADGGELSNIGSTGTIPASHAVVDSDLADTRRSQGTLSAIETELLASDEDIVFEFSSGMAFAYEGTCIMIAEIAA